MARSDLLLNLVRAGSTGDERLLRRTLEALVAEERAKQHNVLADRLEEYLNHEALHEKGPTDERLRRLLYEVRPKRAISDLVLPLEMVTTCRELVEEHQRKDLLRSFNLEPRNRILLVGPPGNGKTSLAEALAYELLLPMYVVRYDGVIASYLGETAVRLAQLFDFVRTRQCVLFLDEFETVGKERGDEHETGEIKRVVSTLLLQVDDLPSHVVVITATNHPELLDRAVWRRFQVRLRLPPPDFGERVEWFRRFQKRVDAPLGYSVEVLAKKLSGASFAELEEFTNATLRRRVLAAPTEDLRPIVSRCLRQWERRAAPNGPASR